MVFIGAGLGGLPKAIENFGKRELDAGTIKSQLASFLFNDHPIATSQEEFAKTTLAYLLANPKANFQAEISGFIDKVLLNFVNTQQAGNKTYGSQTEVFNVFKDEFSTLINDMLGTIFQGSDKNPKAQAQKSAFESKFDQFWQTSGTNQQSKHASRLESLVAVKVNPVTVIIPPVTNSPSIINPAAMGVITQVASSTTAPTPVPEFDPLNISDVLTLATDDLSNTLSKVKIPHAQLKEYATAYGDLIQGRLSEDVLKLAIDSVNPGIRLDVASKAMPEIEKFITKCLEADGIRLAESKAQNINPAEIQTLINSPKAQENLNEILKKLGLEYDFQALTLRQNAFIDQVPDYVGKIAQLDISGLTAEQGSSTLNVNNQEQLREICESIVDKKDTTIQHLSFIGYPEAPAKLASSVYFEDLITDSNRSDLILELPYSLEALDIIKNLKAQELAKDSGKLMPEIRFIHASLEDSDIPALRGLIQQAAAKAEPNAEISSELKPTLEAYANKTSAERNRVKGLLTSATKDGGYGLDETKDKSYIDYVLNAIAPESVKGGNDVYDLQGYRNNLAEAFRNSMINNSTNMGAVRNPLVAVINQARQIEADFKDTDALPKISDVLEKALFAAKPDTQSKSYSSLAYFYWVERGLSHPELLKELAVANKPLSQPALSEKQAKNLLKGYFEIATASNDLEKSKKLSSLIAEGFTVELLVEKFKLMDAAMGAKYSDYLSQNSSYNEEVRPPLSRLDIFAELRKRTSQQVSSFIDKEINSLKSANPSSITQVSEESIDLYKQLFISSAKSFTAREFLFRSLIDSSDITDAAIKVSTGRIDKLIEDFQALDSVLIPSLKGKLPHLEVWAKPLLEEESTNWQGAKVSVRDSLSSYKDLDLQGLLNHGKQKLHTLFMSELYKPGPDGRLYKTDAEREELLNYINKFDGISPPADIYSQEFKDRAKAAFLNSENKTPEAFAQSIDLAHARVNSMQNDSLHISLNHLLGNNLYTLIKPFVNVSSEDQEALEQLKTSLKTDNSAANLLNVINLNKDDLIQLGVKREQASVENLARYMRYQESPNNDALKLDMQARYKSLTEGDNPAPHAQAIVQVHQEFKEFLQAYDNSQLASRLEAIGKQLKSAVSDNEPSKFPDFTKLSELQIMSDFSLELGTVNPTNILNRKRIDYFIDSHSHKLDDGSVMLGLPKESLGQEREYIHLKAKEYQDFSKVMADYFAENINLSETNIRRDDLIIHPSVPQLLDNAGGLLNTGSTENASKLLLITNPGLKFGGMNFVEEGGLLLPKGLTEAGSPLVTTQEPGTLVSKDTINLTPNAFKIYTLASEAKASTLKDFTPTSNIAYNLNLGDYAREALLELNAKQSQEKEEKTLIADTFRSLLSANSQDIPARFAAYETKNGILPELYKDLGWNNVFLESLKINQVDSSKATHEAAEYLTRGIDQALSEKAPAQKTKFIEGIEKMFEVFEAVYLKIFSNAETSSGATLGEGKVKPLMGNQEVQAYFTKNKTAGFLAV
jgi:hypothetical protein